MNKETFRMQMLAGIITEGQYKEKLNEEEIPQITVSDIETLKQDPKIQSFAKKLAQNHPEELEKAKEFLRKAGINVGINESLEDISQGELNKAMDYVSTLNEINIEKMESDYGDFEIPKPLYKDLYKPLKNPKLGFLGALGGTIASFVPGVLPYASSLIGLGAASPLGGVALVAASAAAPYLAIAALIAIVYAGFGAGG